MAVYPHRWAIPRETWARFFASAEHEIGILAYSALFLAEDAGLLRIIGDKGRAALKSGSALATPIAPTSPTAASRKASATPCQPRSATPWRSTARWPRIPTSRSGCTRAVLYNSIYRADDQLS